MNIKKTLTEAFDPSVPGWLQAELADAQYIDGGAAKQLHGKSSGAAIQKKRQAISKKFGVNIAPRTYNSKGGRANYRPWSIIKAYGIDPNKMKVHVEPVPAKGSDPILSNPEYICFFHIQADGYDQVYIKDPDGMGDALQSIVPNKNGEYKSLKYLPYPLLKEATVDFCYVDIKESAGADAIQQKRVVDRIGSIDRYSDKERATHWYEPIDKSGYITNPNKYTSKLAEIGYKNMGKRYDGIYKQLKDIRKDLLDSLREIDIADDDGGLRAMGTLLGGQFSDVVDKYNSAMIETENITRVDDEGYADRAKRMAKSLMDNGYISPKALKERTDILDKNVSRYRAAVADWEDEYTDSDFWS